MFIKMRNLQFIGMFGMGFLLFWMTVKVKSLKMEQVSEGTCKELRNETQAIVNLTWFGSIENWYVPAGSMRHMYLMTLRQFDYNQTALESIPEYRFYYDACFTFQNNGSGIGSVRGFERGLVSYSNVSLAGDGIIDFVNLRQDGGGAIDSSRNYISLTDNRSFVFLTSCELQENLKSWTVVSTEPELSDDVMRMIEKHAIEQGFDEEQFVFMRYDSCQHGVARNCPGRGSGDPWGMHHHHRGPPRGFRGRGPHPYHHHHHHEGMDHRQWWK